MAKINKKLGQDTLLLGSEIVVPEHETITSGSLNIDVALGGGWAVNHFIEIIGHESAGKTLLVLKTIAANQAIDPNWTTVWFAAEDFVEEYATMLGVDTSRVIVENETAMETVYEHTMDFLKTHGVDCVVIDSLPALVPLREEKGTMEDFQPGTGAILTNKFFRMSNQYMKRSLTSPDRPVTCFVINQWRSKIGGYGDPRTTNGGQGKNYACFQRVDIRRDEWIKNTRDQPIGQALKVTNIKNKYAPPHRIGTVDVYFAKGRGFEAGQYDLGKDAVSAGLAYHVIKLGGSTYTFRDYKWRGRIALEEAIAEDPELRDELREAVLYATTLSEPEEVTEPQPKAATNGRAKKSVSPARKGRSKTTRSGTAQGVRVRTPKA
jgi:recombination protein RecA